MKVSKIKFSTWLAIVSIIGLLAIFFRAAFSVDIGFITEALLFIIIGFSLFVIGGAKFFAYFEDGLTSKEIVRLIYSGIGIVSAITGLLTLPLFNTEIVVANVVKATIAIIAIGAIMIEEIRSYK